MRRVLVDHARGKNRQKRGGDVDIIALEENMVGAPGPDAGVHQAGGALLAAGSAAEVAAGHDDVGATQAGEGDEHQADGPCPDDNNRMPSGWLIVSWILKTR